MSRWGGLGHRQRRLLWGAAVILLLAVLAAFWIQAEHSRAQLAAELPRLRASIAALERDAIEVARLRSLPAAPARGPAAARSPLAALATDAGGVPGARITVLDERRVRLASDDMAFGALLDWLRRAQSSHGMRVDSARVDALAAPGRVRAELILTKG